MKTLAGAQLRLADAAAPAMMDVVPSSQDVVRRSSLPVFVLKQTATNSTCRWSNLQVMLCLFSIFVV